MKKPSLRARITRTTLRMLGYRKGKGGKYQKRQDTHGGRSRCKISVVLRKDGLADVYATQRARVKGGPTGYNFACNFIHVQDIVDFERCEFVR